MGDGARGVAAREALALGVARVVKGGRGGVGPEVRPTWEWMLRGEVEVVGLAGEVEEG